jgi:hypothetical protein
MAIELKVADSSVVSVDRNWDSYRAEQVGSSSHKPTRIAQGLCSRITSTSKNKKSPTASVFFSSKKKRCKTNLQRQS